MEFGLRVILYNACTDLPNFPNNTIYINIVVFHSNKYLEKEHSNQTISCALSKSLAVLNTSENVEWHRSRCN